MSNTASPGLPPQELPPPPPTDDEESIPPPPRDRGVSDVPPPPPAPAPEDADTGASSDEDAVAEDFADEEAADADGADPWEATQNAVHRRRMSAHQTFDEDDLFSSSDDEDFKQRMSVGSSSSSGKKAKPRDNIVSRNSALSVPDVSVSSSSRRGRGMRQSIISQSSQYLVSKTNKYGVGQKRLLMIDVFNRTLRFLTAPPEAKLKSEFPFLEMVEILRQVKSPRSVVVVFRAGRRYQLKFETLSQTEEFCAKAKAILEQNVFFNRDRSDQYDLSPSAPEVSRVGLPNSDSVDEYDELPGPPPSAPFTGLASISEVGRHARNDSIDDDPNRPPTPSFGIPEELEDEELLDGNYLDYHVMKKNKYGIKQDRILVLNTSKKALLLMDDRRKFKKQFDTKDILQVEIPKSKTGKSRAYLIFDASVEQKPFNLYFVDVFDRIHFCERLSTLGKHITIKDASEESVSPHTLRFTVVKVNKMGVKKKRILYLDCIKKLVRSVNLKSDVKDTPIGDSRITRIEKSYIDRRALTIGFSSRDDWNFIFSDAAARDRFVVRCRAIADGLYDMDPAFPWTDPFAPFMQTSSKDKKSLPSAGATTESKSDAKEDELDTMSAHERVSIFVGTWNVGSAEYSKENIEKLIPPLKHDVYVLALQEAPKREQYIKEIKQHIMQIPAGSNQPETYVMLMARNLWEILMVVFVRKEHLHRISNIEVDTVACGVGDMLGNKGGVGLAFMYNETRLCFICSHLAARAERLPQRRENYQRILGHLDAKFGRPDFDASAQLDHVIWFGDLNYRIEIDFDEVLGHIKEQKWQTLQAQDQLLKEIQSKQAFVGFEEGPLTFPPTYRMERESDEYSNKRRQAPSWTDRVLWRSQPNNGKLRLCSYTGLPSVKGSDHRPVVATFELLATLPYAAGIDPAFSKDPPCEIMFSGLCLDLKKAFLGGAEPPKLLLRIGATFLEADVDTMDVSAAPAKDKDEITYAWQEQVWVNPFVFIPSYLESSHIIIAACKTEAMHDLAASIGNSVLSLKSRLVPKGSAFNVPLMKNGTVIGSIRGDVSFRKHT